MEAAATSLQAISILLPSNTSRGRSNNISCASARARSYTPRWRCSTLRNLDGGGDCDRRRIVEHSPSISNSNTSPSPHSATPPGSQNSHPSSPPSQGLILGLASWDANALGSPVVKRFLSDDEERWHMWYHGRSSPSAPDSIGLAISSNGAHWDCATNPVLHRSSDWWAFDTAGVRPSDVLVMASSRVRASTAVYWLYYTGFNSPGGPADPDASEAGAALKLKALPGLAMSQDGRHWARIEGEHHSGALLDVGGEGEWDSIFIAGPSVAYHRSGDLRMYYHSFDPNAGGFGIGMARSRDGIRWVKLGKVLERGPTGSFDEAGVLNGHVVGVRNGGYVMAYEGIDGNGRRSIGLAESPDGLKEWRRRGDGAILMPQAGWDSVGVGCPCLVRMDGGSNGQWRLYYSGIGGEGMTGIGMAESVSEGDKFPSSFRRWTGFHHS